MASPPATALAPPDFEIEDDADADHGEAWEREIDRRIEDVRSGRVETVPMEDVIARIRAKHGWA